MEEEVAMYCDVRGYNTSISRHAICSLDGKLCDKGIDQECWIPPTIGVSCSIHKHQLCDGVPDCVGGIDEKCDPTAKEPVAKLSNITCVRVFNSSLDRRSLEIPESWLGDGVIDCIDRVDENYTTDGYDCGKGKWWSHTTKNEDQCKYVYVCNKWERKFVTLDKLCDGLNTCGYENEVCAAAQGQLTDRIVSSDWVFTNSVANFCLKGLENLQRHKNMTCVPLEMASNAKPNLQSFLVETEMKSFTVPDDIRLDCSNLYGEVYILMACNGFCNQSNIICPVSSRRLNETSCPSQYKDRVYTLAKDEEGYFLTFAQGRNITNESITDSPSNDTISPTNESPINEPPTNEPPTIEPPIYKTIYETPIVFPCDNNKKCISYKQVCDLVNDCGDWSDENSCSNHFKCEDKNKIKMIEAGRKCDGVYNCPDMTDECNEDCDSDYIIKDTGLAVSGWVIGIVATLLNMIAVTVTVRQLVSETSLVKWANLFFICLIGIGDLLVGIYLIFISAINATKHGEFEYCKNKYERWLSRPSCAFMGVLSTTGAQLSLFAMTILSITRVVCITTTKMKGTATIRSKAVVMIVGVILIVIALVIAGLPLVDTFEDFFVNELVYIDNNPMFIGKLTQ
eukprot:sb/3463034/